MKRYLVDFFIIAPFFVDGVFAAHAASTAVLVLACVVSGFASGAALYLHDQMLRRRIAHDAAMAQWVYGSMGKALADLHSHEYETSRRFSKSDDGGAA